VIGELSYLIFFLIFVSIFAIAVLGLNLQWGFTGQFNAGVVGFFAVGAYAMAILTGPTQPRLPDQAFQVSGIGLPFALGLLGAIGVSAAIAYVIGLVTVRLRHDYLAITTFGIAIVIHLVTINFESLTAGTLGFVGIPRPLASTFATPFAHNVAYLAMMFAITGAVFWGLERIVRSPWGRVLKAVREDDVAAIAVGKNADRYRLEAFVIGCALMGLAGALYAAYIGSISPFDFLPIMTFQIWTMMIVGGSGNNRGALLGALVVWGLWTSSGALVSQVVPAKFQAQGGAIQVILIGLVLVGTLLFRPRGLIGEEPKVSRYVD